MKLDPHQLQVAFGLIVGGGAALATVHRLITRTWPWLKERWANRTSRVMLAGLATLQAQGETAVTERRALMKEFSLFRATVGAIVASDETIATFEASPDGLLITANRTYLKWTGKTLEELKRWGWINSVVTEDRGKVRTEWDSACRDVRQSELFFRMLDADGQAFKVRATASPIPEGERCEKFVGVIHLLEAPPA